MKREIILNSYDIFALGQWIEFLGYTVTIGDVWKVIRMALEEVCKFRIFVDLRFITNEAKTHLDELSQKYSENQRVRAQDLSDLQAVVGRWEGRLHQLLPSWVVSIPQAHIDAYKLMKGIKGFLDDNEIKALKPIEYEGLTEAASSLLHNNFTSAEFMALRTAESLLRRWYEKTTDSTLERARWGEVLEELNSKFPKEQRPKELSLLEYLRGRRNEIAHPEAISDEQKAVTTFYNVIEISKIIAKDLINSND